MLYHSQVDVIPQKQAFHKNHTQIWVSIYLPRMQPTPRPKASCTGTRRQVNLIKEPVTETQVLYLIQISKHNSISLLDEATVRSPKFSDRLAYYNIVFCREQKLGAVVLVRLHIRKPKPQAPFKDQVNSLTLSTYFFY